MRRHCRRMCGVAIDTAAPHCRGICAGIPPTGLLTDCPVQRPTQDPPKRPTICSGRPLRALHETISGQPASIHLLWRDSPLCPGGNAKCRVAPTTGSVGAIRVPHHRRLCRRGIWAPLDGMPPAHPRRAPNHWRHACSRTIPKHWPFFHWVEVLRTERRDYGRVRRGGLQPTYGAALSNLLFGAIQVGPSFLAF